MPSGKNSESLQHNCFTTVNAQNQSKLNGTLIDSTFSCKLLETSSTNIIPSNNEVTSNLKRPLQDNLDFNVKVKKFKESREEQYSLNNDKLIEEHHISLLIEKLDKIVESDKINGNKHNVSNEQNNGSCEKDFSINGPINSGSNKLDNCSGKKSVSKESSQNIEKKSDNVSNDINNCVLQAMKMNTETTGNNDDIENNHISLLIEKLDKIVESDKINGNKHHNVSSESNNGSSEKDISINDPINSGSNKLDNCSGKRSVSKEGSQSIEKNSDNVSNDINNCVSQAIKMNTEITGNNDDIENDHISLLIEKLDKIVESDKMNSNKHPNVSNDSNNVSCDKDISTNDSINSGSNKLDNCSGKRSVSKEGSQNIEKKSDNVSNDINNCVSQAIKMNTETTGNDDIENDHISLLIDKLDKIVESDKMNDNKHNVSNDSNNVSCEKDISVNDSINSGSNKQEICCGKGSVSKEGSQNIEKKYNVSNDNCVSQAMKMNVESTSNNDNIEDNHQLIRPLPSENIGVGENSEDIDVAENSEDKNVDGDFPVIKNIESGKNNDLSLDKDNVAQMSTKNTNGIETIANEPENNNNKVENEISNLIEDKNGEIIESDYGSGVIVDDFDGSNTNKESDGDDEGSKVCTTQQRMKNLATSVLYELFREKDNVCERWESFVKFKCMEYLTDKDARGRERREAEYTLRIQQLWIDKFTALIKSLSNYEVKVKNHVAKFKNVPKQIKTCRSVALQADFYSFEDKDSLVKLQRRFKLNPPLQQFDSSTVNISSDDDDVVLVEPTTTPSLSITEINTKSKRHSSTLRSTSSCIPSKSKKLMVSTFKSVPPAIPINGPAIINIESIDLTENDEVNEVPKRLNLDKAFKVLRCSKINTSASTLPGKDLSTQALPKNVTFIETSQLPTSSHYVVKKSTAAVSNQLTAASNLPTVSFESNSSLQPIVINPSRKFLHFSPVSTQLQPSTSAVTLNSCQINQLASQLNSSRLIRPQLTRPQLIRPQLIRPKLIRPKPTKSQQIGSSITVVQSTRPQHAVTHLTKPQYTMVQSTTRPQFTIVQSTTSPKISMVQSTKPQQSRLLPVPPAIPLKITHPAPLPPMPIQRSLPSWKKLPSAPVLTVSQKKRGEVLLSWVVPRYSKPSVATIISFEIFAYLVDLKELPRTSNWLLVGEANALPLPMACTLTKLQRSHMYYFAVRAVDVHTRVGPFSLHKMLKVR